MKLTAVVPRRSGVPVEFAQAPMRTIRVADAKAVYAYPAAQVARLVRRGLLHQLAVGYYVVVPQDRVGTEWKPSMEAAAGAIGAAAVGVADAVLTGLTAARLHNAVPRALAMGLVAAPRRRHDIRLRDRVGAIHFLTRDTNRLDAELMTTELGQCLVTTLEQTVLDLQHNPRLGNATQEADAAIRTLWPRCDLQRLQQVAADAGYEAVLRRLLADMPVRSA